MDAEMSETATKEGVDIQRTLAMDGGELVHQDGTTEKAPDTRDKEKECEDEEAADMETADDGLCPSKGSDDEDKESEGQKEAADANNNSVQTPTPETCREDFIDIPEITEQVSRED